MSDNKQTYLIRIEAQNGKEVEAILQKIGETGEKSFVQVSKSVNSTNAILKGSLDPTLSLIKDHLMGIAGPAAAGYFVKQNLDMAKSSIEMADSIGKTATRLGLSAREFQGYGYAAKLAGVDQDEYTTAMDRFNRVVGDAIGGNKEVQATLLSLGVSTDKVKNGQLSFGQAFLTVSDNIKRYGTAQERAAVLASLFGKENGPKMGEMLSQGRAAILASAKEAENLGLVIDDSLIQKATEAGDKIDTLGEIIRVNFTRGMLDGAIDGYSTFAEMVKDPEVAAGIRELGSLMGELARLTLQVASGIGTIAKVVNSGGFAGKALEDTLSPLGGIYQKVKAVQEKYTPWAAGDQLKGAPTPSTSVPVVSNNSGNAGKILTIEQIKAQQESARKSIDLAAQEKKKIDDVIQSLVFKGEQLKRSSEEQEINNNLRAAGVSLSSEEGQRIAALTRANFELEKQQERNRKMTELWKDSISDLEGAFNDLHSFAIHTLSQIGQALIDIGSGTGRGSGLGGLLVNGAMSLFGSSSSSNGWGVSGSLGSTLNTLTNLSTLPARASGGPVLPMSDYLVGERGPEVLRLGTQGGSIVPNSQIGGGMTIQYLDARGADRQGLQELQDTIRQLNGKVDRINSSVEGRAIQAVQSKQRRSTTYMRG